MEPIYVTKPFLPPIDEYIGYLEKIWECGILTNNGPLHNEFEQKLCSDFGWKNVSLFTNGHLALEVALRVLDLKPGSEIITTPFTFVSTAASIVNQGFIPVFCDIGENCTIDTTQIESLITEKTSAILPVHVYGFPCDVDGIANIADRYNLKVLYDAAHAIGVRVNGRDISSYGDISMFSFHSTKLFHTIEGGALVYNDDKLKTHINLCKNFGISGSETIELVGLNAKMSEFQSAMGLLSLKYLDSIIERRKSIYERYMSNLFGVKGIKIFLADSNYISHNYSYVPVLFENGRDCVYDVLTKNNIFPRKYFYPAISNIDCYKKYLGSNTLDVTASTASQVLTLPIYPTLSLDNVDKICEIVKDAIR